MMITIRTMTMRIFSNSSNDTFATRIPIILSRTLPSFPVLTYFHARFGGQERYSFKSPRRDIHSKVPAASTQTALIRGKSPLETFLLTSADNLEVDFADQIEHPRRAPPPPARPLEWNFVRALCYRHKALSLPLSLSLSLSLVRSLAESGGGYSALSRRRKREREREKLSDKKDRRTRTRLRSIERYE